MSGFSSFSRDSTPTLFADISSKKGGIIIRAKKDESGAIVEPEQVHSRYQGVVTKIDWKDNGKAAPDTITNLRVHTKDLEGNKAMLSVALGTFHAGKVAGLFNAIDLHKPFDLRVNAAKAGEKVGDMTMDKDTTFVTMWQEGKKLAPVYTQGKDKLPDAPPLLLASGKPVMQGGMAMKDMDAVNAEVTAVINVLMEKSDKLGQGQGHHHGVSPTDAVPAEEEDGIDMNDAAATVQAAAPRPAMGQRG